MKKLTAVAAFAALATLAAPGVQAGNGSNTASMSIQIRAMVPVICRVQMLGGGVGTPGQDGVVHLGQAAEFCNSGAGYRVIVNHSPNLQDAALIVDGMRVPMSPSGVTVMSDIHHAAVRNVSLAVDPGDAPEQLAYLGLQIDPK